MKDWVKMKISLRVSKSEETFEVLNKDFDVVGRGAVTLIEEFY